MMAVEDMTVEGMLKILKGEFGISSIEEFDRAYEQSPGLDIGIFVSDIGLRKESDDDTRSAGKRR